MSLTACVDSSDWFLVPGSGLSDALLHDSAWMAACIPCSDEVNSMVGASLAPTAVPTGNNPVVQALLQPSHSK